MTIDTEPRTRLNDGKCDRRGRFFAGQVTHVEDGKTFYLADTFQGGIRGLPEPRFAG